MGIHRGKSVKLGNLDKQISMEGSRERMNRDSYSMVNGSSQLSIWGRKEELVGGSGSQNNGLHVNGINRSIAIVI